MKHEELSVTYKPTPENQDSRLTEAFELIFKLIEEEYVNGKQPVRTRN